MKEITTYVGVDAHKKDLFIAMLIGNGRTPVTWTVPNEPQAVRRLVRKLEREALGPVRCCYEAGPCGCALQRRSAVTVVAYGGGLCVAGRSATRQRPSRCRFR